jgi:hypothetical protein
MKAMAKVPSFLNSVELSESEIKKHSETLSNWLRAHNYIRDLPDDRRTLNILERLMLVEYRRKPGPRMDILVRLHGRYSRVRHEVERVELSAA